jgi:hypothetical protein
VRRLRRYSRYGTPRYALQLDKNLYLVTGKSHYITTTGKTDQENDLYPDSVLGAVDFQGGPTLCLGARFMFDYAKQVVNLELVLRRNGIKGVLVTTTEYT